VKRLTIVVVGLAIALPATLTAHRLDEYLQASRLSLLTDGVGVEIDLTPGSSVAADVSALIDADANGDLTPAEVERYARRVLADLALEANGDALSLRLTGAQAATIDDMMAGLGTIRITAIGDRPGIGRGRARLHYRNNHTGPSSVYLVNALVPRDGGVRVMAQTRDDHQREIALEFEKAGSTLPRLAWLLAGVLAIGGLVVLRQR
jgi:hypothetical protein